MKTPRACPAFEPDEDTPPDHRGRRVCVNCHRVGEPRDPGHTPPPVPQPRQPNWLAEAAMGRDAAVLGEDDREEYR